MSFINLNSSPFGAIAAIIILFLLALAKGQLLLNEEFLLILNFFLLLGFFYQYVAEVLKGFLSSRQELIRHEAHRVLSMHRHNANRLKESYHSKRFTAQIGLSGSARLQQFYQIYHSQIEPRLLPSYLNGAFILALETIYNEELQLLRSLYLTKVLLIKRRLVESVSDQIEPADSLENSLVLLECK